MSVVAAVLVCLLCIAVVFGITAAVAVLFGDHRVDPLDLSQLDEWDRRRAALARATGNEREA